MGAELFIMQSYHMMGLFNLMRTKCFGQRHFNQQLLWGKFIISIVDQLVT